MSYTVPPGQIIMKIIANTLTTVLRGLIRFYQLALSPYMQHSCRYRPTCSQYSIEAIQRYGPLKGTYLALRRIIRCHPFSKGGFDPLP